VGLRLTLLQLAAGSEKAAALGAHCCRRRDRIDLRAEGCQEIR
jgi:hypothetical protein